MESISRPTEIAQLPGNDVPPELVKRWNWGAFLLSGLWPFWHGSPWLAIASLACGLTSALVVPALIGLALSIYLGFKGNEIAVRRRRYASAQEFVAVEGAWARWAIGVALGGLALYAVALVATIVLHIPSPSLLRH